MAKWTDNGVRSDGYVVIYQPAAGTWAICSPDRFLARECPCCGEPLLTERSAKLVCDKLFPAGSETEGRIT